MPADWRWLPYLLRFQRSLEPQDITGSEDECSDPVYFPDDPDETLTVSFSCTLNEFTKILSSLIKGAQLSYPDSFVDVMNMFLRNWGCDVDICERMAECLTSENPALINALADALRNNPTLLQALSDGNAENGGATPGQPISDQQAAQSFLPENVKDGDDCDLDALWGACLYLVQSANRAITDVYEQIEVATNTLEAMAIGAEVIPAAGNYVSAAAQFADQLLENISEGYAGAYTEEYEEQMACLLFCLAKNDDCNLDLESVLNAIGARLDFTEVLPDFGVLMTEVGAGTWSGDSIADVSFWIYFAALRFGQVYGGTIGIRPLTVLMSLGADQLASDNWEILCACPEPCVAPSFRIVNPIGYSGGTVDVVDNMDGTWTVTAVASFDTNAYRMAFVEENTGCCWNTVSASFTHTPDNLNAQYNCGANPNDTEYDNGIGTGPLTPDLCASGAIGSDVDDAFTLTWLIEACP